MNLVARREAWYPAFHLGFEPNAVKCDLCIVEANGRKYLKTPFAMLNAYADDDHERAVDGRGFYASEAEVNAYLANEYPWAERARPIMDKLCTLRHHHGDLVGTGRAADFYGVSVDAIFKLARGHRSFTLKQVKDALKRN